MLLRMIRAIPFLLAAEFFVKVRTHAVKSWQKPSPARGKRLPKDNPRREDAVKYREWLASDSLQIWVIAQVRRSWERSCRRFSSQGPEHVR